MLKMLLFSFHLQWLLQIATQSTSFDVPVFFFLTHADMTAVTIQLNKIVSNEVKGN